MRWEELRRKLDAVPGHAETLERELPGREIALAVASLRAEHDLTQAQFAERIGTTQSVIARAESGRRLVNTRFLNRIAKAFGLSWQPVFAPREISTEAARVDPAVLQISPLGVEPSLGYASSEPRLGGRPPLRILFFEHDPTQARQTGYQIVLTPDGQAVPFPDRRRGAVRDNQGGQTVPEVAHAR